MEKASKLRELLKGKGPVVLAGAHNGLGARLVEGAGFDGVWASSFEISASQGLPDANLLSLSENLAVVRMINEATQLPVIADCDNGYGNAINVIRTVREYERAGIAGICIEDNLFPKRCSFYEGTYRELEPVEEFAGKIRAAKQAQSHPDFLVIARTEALILGLGMEEALNRAGAYARAGADLILAHSKSPHPEEVLAFAARWEGPCPLVAIPTTYSQISVEELHRAGFRLIIFANHGLRASLAAMRSTFQELRRQGRAAAVEGRIAALEEVYELVQVGRLLEQEKQFLPHSSQRPRAVILAAGKGFQKELGGLIDERPKCLLQVHGKTLLERQVEMLRAANIQEIAVVRGYQGHMIRLPRLRYYDNPDYASTHTLLSLFCAEEWMTGSLLVLYSDILFEESLLARVLQTKGDIVLVVDHAWYDSYRNGVSHPVSRPELVQTSRPPVHFYRFLPPNGNRVLRIGRSLEREAADGEFIGVAYFSRRGVELLRQAFHALYPSRREEPFYEAPTLVQASLADMIQYLIDQGQEVAAVDIYKGWLEVDTFEDYLKMWQGTLD